MKTFALVLALTLSAEVSATARFDYDGTPSGNKKCALINVIMDESASMSRDQSFMKNKVLPKLGTTLHSAAYGYDEVFFCSAGFGYNQIPNYADYRHLGCTKLSAAGGIGSPLVSGWLSNGLTEDGWYAMKQGMADVYAEIEDVNLLNDCATIDKNLILITDEDRDTEASVSKSWIKQKIYDNGYILNVVVNICIGDNKRIMSCRGKNAPYAPNFGMKLTDGGMNATIFEYEPIAPLNYIEVPVLNTYYDDYVLHNGATKDHYSDLVVDEAGAVWSINSMRARNPGIAEAFADVFVTIKAQEISGCTEKCGDEESEIGGDPHITTWKNKNTPAGSLGDPHFRTWKNDHFEYHGQCDLMLAKDLKFADGLGIQVEIRTKLVRFWSYIKSAAIRIGDDILEVQGTEPKDGIAQYWMNLEYQGSITSIGGFPITLTMRGRTKHSFMIDLGSKFPGEKIEISAYREFVKVDFINASEASFGNAVGMLGDLKTGKLLGRDGTTEVDDYLAFGAEWQVRPDEDMLFYRSEDPQFPKACVIPEDPQGERRRRLDEQSVDVKQAEAACAGLKNPLDRKDCVYDVLATQDLDMVGAF